MVESEHKISEPGLIREPNEVTTIAKSDFPTPKEAEVMRDDIRRKRILERTPEITKSKVIRKGSGSENGDVSKEALEDDWNLKALYEISGMEVMSCERTEKHHEDLQL